MPLIPGDDVHKDPALLTALSQDTRTDERKAADRVKLGKRLSLFGVLICAIALVIRHLG